MGRFAAPSPIPSIPCPASSFPPSRRGVPGGNRGGCFRTQPQGDPPACGHSDDGHAALETGRLDSGPGRASTSPETSAGWWCRPCRSRHVGAGMHREASASKVSRTPSPPLREKKTSSFNYDGCRVAMEKVITKSDTDGEVSFVGTRVLTNLFFGPVPKVNCGSWRLRQQYQK